MTRITLTKVSVLLLHESDLFVQEFLRQQFSMTKILEHAHKKTCLPKINRSSSFLLFLAQYIDAFNIIVSKHISCLKYARIYVSEPDSSILRKRNKYLAQIGVVIFSFRQSLCELRRSFAKYIDLVEERENKKSIEIRVHKRGEKVTNIRINANAYMRLRKNISEFCDVKIDAMDFTQPKGVE